MGTTQGSIGQVRAGRETGTEGKVGEQGEGTGTVGGDGTVDQETALRAEIVTVVKGKFGKSSIERTGIQFTTTGALSLRKGETTESCRKIDRGGRQDQPGVLGERDQEQAA